MNSIVIYLPEFNSFYGGIRENGISVILSTFDECMHFNSLFCTEWYVALVSLTKNDLQFEVFKCLN